MTGLFQHVPDTQRHQEIRTQMKDIPLAWFGTRGMDAIGLFALSPPEAVVSQIAAIPSPLGESVKQDCLEERLSRRLDLDRYDIDADASSGARHLRSQFLEQARPPKIIVAYRSAEFLSAASFCDRSLITAFNFHLFQRQFEHKPWVERALSRSTRDVPMLPTIYIRDNDEQAITAACAAGPQVGRTSTGSGGAGVFFFTSYEEFIERLPAHRDGFVAVSPYLEDALPLNINACVYDDGVSVFGVSTQLIGIKGLTTRTFGFCGNDFGAAAYMSDEDLDQIEIITQKIGEWLRTQGYRGLFGADILQYKSNFVVSEVNARFQASTVLSTSINQYLGLPDPTTEHVAAFLGMNKPDIPSVREQTKSAADTSGKSATAQVFHRNVLADAIYVDGVPETGDTAAIDCVPTSSTLVEEEALMFRSLHSHVITVDGYQVEDAVMALSRDAKKGF